jgi:hypothetical protein
MSNAIVEGETLVESRKSTAADRALELLADRNVPNIRRLFWLAAVITGLLQAWAFRHVARSDGIAYMDIAWACAHGEWHNLINAQWSPLYPFLLGLSFRLLRPTLYWESTIVHLMNFVIFVFAFFCFEVFLKQLIRSRHTAFCAPRDDEALPGWALWMLGDSLFIYLSLLFIHIEALTPDLCVAALVFLTSAFLLRIRSGKGGWAAYPTLGAILGIGYFAKAVMFPMTFVFLTCCVLSTRPFRRGISRTAVALAVFLLVSAPFLVALSKSKGRLTFGDAGRIAYAAFVDSAAHGIHWQGGPDGTGTPVHPTRMLLATPPVFEFATPVKGTYPPWYDPSYWYEGVKPVFNVRNQLRDIRYTIEEYAGILPYMAGVLVGFLGMALYVIRDGSLCRDIIENWVIWLPGTAALALYALVYVEARFVAPFFVLVWIGLFASLRFPRSRSAQVFVRCMTLATVITLGVGIAWLAGRALFRALAPQSFENWEVAQGLKDLGIRPGSDVASIGYALDGYWAHLAGVRIVAEVPLSGVSAYWASPPEIQSKVLADFASAGAKIVVTEQGLPLGSASGWQRIGQTSYFAHDLRAVSSGTETREK